MNRILITMLSLTAVALAQEPTAAEREKAARYLTETRQGVEQAVKNLNEAQWRYKPAADRWSVAEIVEHLAVIEDILKVVFAKLPDGPPPAADRNAAKFDTELLAKVTDRSTKVEAPPNARPTARWTPEGALQHFVASRAYTAGLLSSTPALRAHTFPHPVFGPLDGYDWILAVAAHTARHTQQILEVKADPGFPVSTAPATAAQH